MNVFYHILKYAWQKYTGYFLKWKLRFNLITWVMKADQHNKEKHCMRVLASDIHEQNCYFNCKKTTWI